MKTPHTASASSMPQNTLLTDYEHWLEFVTTSRQTIRQYDHQLAQISTRFPDLSSLSDYLRERMHDRAQFFGRLAIHLTATVAQLRTNVVNTGLLYRLTDTHQTMQHLINDLEAALVDISASYQTLLVTLPAGSTVPMYHANHARS